MHGNSEKTTVELMAIDYASKFDGQIIYVESLKMSRHWLSTKNPNSHVFWLELHENDVVDDIQVKWRVTKLYHGVVALENVHYK